MERSRAGTWSSGRCVAATPCDVPTCRTGGEGPIFWSHVSAPCLWVLILGARGCAVLVQVAFLVYLIVGWSGVELHDVRKGVAFVMDDGHKPRPDIFDKVHRHPTGQG